MDEWKHASWFRDYVLLAFRMDKVLRAVSEHSPFVDYYYGPPGWREQVAASPLVPAPELLDQALDLAEVVSGLDLEPQRATFLHKQVRAMQTVCQKLCGETLSLEEELERCFDLSPSVALTKTPEALFEQLWARAEETLPGTGGLQERINALEQQVTLLPERAEQLVDLLGEALAEVRRRTHTFLELPSEEAVVVRAVRGQRWLANNVFQGQACSFLDINLDTFTSVRNLLTLAAHEGYPGHHTEYVLKEQHLYRKQGHLEQAICLLISPQVVISEGIATLAASLLFSPEEELHWLAEYLYPKAGLVVEPEAALWASPTDKLWMAVRRNAAALLHEGRAEHEVQDYLQQYLRLPAGRAAQILAYLRRPFREAYIFTYTAGAELLRPWLQGPDRHRVFARFLIEPITPSALLG
jgi:hypothetical protein